MDSVGNM